MIMINIAEILKDCPTGMELDCTIWNNCTYYGIEDLGYINILIKTPCGVINLSKEGCFSHNCCDAKCVIFPKGKTTWEGFQRPFKEGDVVTYKLRGSLVAFIYKERISTLLVKSHFALYAQNMGFSVNKEIALKENELVFATEEEKQKLFDAIKENGYKWNSETKTLEKLIVPKFKVGDMVRLKSKPNYVYNIHSLTWDENNHLAYRLLPDNDKHLIVVCLHKQEDYELVPSKFDISTFMPFDKVLIRSENSDIWECDIFSSYNSECSNPYHCIGAWYEQCVPYEGNEHLLGTTNDCDEYYKTW